MKKRGRRKRTMTGVEERNPKMRMSARKNRGWAVQYMNSTCMEAKSRNDPREGGAWGGRCARWSCEPLLRAWAARRRHTTMASRASCKPETSVICDMRHVTGGLVLEMEGVFSGGDVSQRKRELTFVGISGFKGLLLLQNGKDLCIQTLVALLPLAVRKPASTSRTSHRRMKYGASHVALPSHLVLSITPV